MRNLLAYLKYRRMALAVYGVTIAVLLAIGALTQTDPLVTRYALLLIGVLMLALLVFDGLSYAAKLAALEQFDTETGKLPAAHDALEAQYQALILRERQTYRRYRDAQSTARAEALEYYTLWVHQIKTPIAALRLLLDESAQDGAALAELFRIEQYADLALRYVKLDSISADLVITRCALLPIVSASIKKYALAFIRRNLTVSIGALPESVTTDAKWLAFILEQIISNSVKYTKVGGVNVYGDGDALVIADTGIGIRPDDLPRIFEKGFTGYNGRLDLRASGIGLSLAKRAADALGIVLTATSAIGSGTQIRLTFPAPDRFDAF